MADEFHTLPPRFIVDFKRLGDDHWLAEGYVHAHAHGRQHLMKVHVTAQGSTPTRALRALMPRVREAHAAILAEPPAPFVMPDVAKL